MFLKRIEHALLYAVDLRLKRVKDGDCSPSANMRQLGCFAKGEFLAHRPCYASKKNTTRSR